MSSSISHSMPFELYQECRINNSVYVYIEKVNKKSLRIKITETDGIQITNQIERNVSIKHRTNQMNTTHISFNYGGKRHCIYEYDDEIKTNENYKRFVDVHKPQFNNECLRDFYGL